MATADTNFLGVTPILMSPEATLDFECEFPYNKYSTGSPPGHPRGENACSLICWV